MYTRQNPYLSHIKERFLLTGSSSSKKTYHLSLSIPEGHFPFKVGDSLGVYVENPTSQVECILKHFSFTGHEPIHLEKRAFSGSLRAYLQQKANLSRVSSNLFQKICPHSPLCEKDNKTQLQAYLSSCGLSELPQPTDRPLTAQELAQELFPLLPRFYSIASSPLVYPGEVHLTIAQVEYVLNGQLRQGVASHFLCSLAQIEKTPIPIYIQPSSHFTLPTDPTTALIMVGPGTGVAPFRAFLQERLALQCPGKHWLFFGERNQKTDFYYASYWKELQEQSRLRLDVAFSRDGPHKYYVQDRMLESQQELWEWIEEGAYFYICGDASQMAKDVEQALLTTFCNQGNLSDEEARNKLRQLRKEKRYLLDVY